VHPVIKLFPVCNYQGTCCRAPYSLVILSWRLLPPTLVACHPERRARKRSARARVEGPLHSLLGTLPSGHPHRALYDRTSCPVQVLRHPHRALYDRTSCRVQASGNLRPCALLSWGLLPPTLFACHPERRARKRSDRARVEGPLHSLLGTLSSGHPHRALYDRTSCRVQVPRNLLPRTLFACHPELAIAAAYLFSLSS
jgi:hypothetical protein